MLTQLTGSRPWKEFVPGTESSLFAVGKKLQFRRGRNNSIIGVFHNPGGNVFAESSFNGLLVFLLIPQELNHFFYMLTIRLASFVGYFFKVISSGQQLYRYILLAFHT